MYNNIDIIGGGAITFFLNFWSKLVYLAKRMFESKLRTGFVFKSIK